MYVKENKGTAFFGKGSFNFVGEKDNFSTGDKKAHITAVSGIGQHVYVEGELEAFIFTHQVNGFYVTHAFRKDDTMEVRVAYVEKDGVRNVSATEILFADHPNLKGELLVMQNVEQIFETFIEVAFRITPSVPVI